MHFRMLSVSVLVALAALSLGTTYAQMTEDAIEADISEFTRRVTQELRDVDAEAAEVFVRANEARDADRFLEAEALYREVLEARPEFFHATRRLCYVVLRQGRRDEALALCREAADVKNTQENRFSLLSALIAVDDIRSLSAEDRSLAAVIAQEIIREAHDHPLYVPLACQTAARLQDFPLLESCVDRMDAGVGDPVAYHYFHWVVAMTKSEWGAAEQALAEARQAGLPDEQYAELLTTTRSAQPLWQRWGPLGLRIGGVWIGGLVLLLAAGIVLSSLTLRAAKQLPTAQTGASVGLTAQLRKLYRTVLWLSCAYYFISIPLVLIAVLLTGGGLIYMFLMLGRIPVKLLLVVLVVMAVTVWAAVKSLFVRGVDADPGKRLDLTDHPRMRGLLDEVAGEIGTRTVDNVYLTPGTDLAVMERGGVLKQLRGGSERCLILGVGVLDDMKIGPFKAIMAHEYGHFSNQDTAGGGFALAVRRSLVTMAQNLAQGGAAAWYNPAWLFLNGFYRVFLRVSQGASRLQEILADRWAVFTYGAKHFENGLRHVIERSIRFDVHTNATLQEVVDQKCAMANFYRYEPQQRPDDSALATATEQAISAEPSPYDSHPSPKDRFEWVHALECGDGRGSLENEAEEVWTLFSDRDAIERLMTDQIRAAVLHNHGVSIAEA